MSLVRVDPLSHQMKAVGDPTAALLHERHARRDPHPSCRFTPAKVLSTGYSSFVGAVSLPSGSETPSTFTYIQPAGDKSVAKAQRVSAGLGGK